MRVTGYRYGVTRAIWCCCHQKRPASAMGTRTTPTRRRRRGNGVLESWAVEQQEPPQMQEPPVREARAPRREEKAPEPPPRPEPASATPLELQSVDAILAATGLLQQLDRIHAEHERTVELRGVDDVHLAYDFRATCAELIQRFPWLALPKGVDQLLWNAWHRELVALEGRVASARSTSTTRELGGGNADGFGNAETKLRDALYVALRDYSTLIQEVKSTRRKLRASDAAASEASTIPLLVQRLLLSHSHILYSLEVHSGKTDKNWRLPELNYELARKWCVEQGEPHNHLARVVLHEGRCAEALYHLVRARTADQPWDTPASLADQFAQLSTLRHEAPNDDRSAQVDAKWIIFDKAALSALEPFFGRTQEFVTHRRAPRELATALGGLLDEICNDSGSWTQENESNVGVFALRLVRIVSLVIACACIPMDFVIAPTAAEATASVQGGSLATLNNQRAVELLASMTNCLLHRCLAAITSPLSMPEQKQQALQLMLPAVNIGFAWLRKHAWRDMVSEATRSHCEQLTTMLLTAIIAGGFMSPQEDPSLLLHSGSPVALAEEIEVCGFKCLQLVDDSVALAAMDAVDADPLCDAGTESELLRCRIERFFTHVQAFMAPRLPTPAGLPDTAPIVHGQRPETSRPADGAISTQLAQVSISDEPQSRVSVTPSAVATAPTNTGTRDVLKPAERVVVLDAANIAMRHGLHRRFSCRGIQLCADYFLAQGDRVVAFLPDYCLEADGDGFSRRRGRRRERSTITPDDQELLKIMVNSGVVVPTPAMDSDDLYCIHYARRHNAFLVTNDLFRDHVSDTDGPRARQVELRQWLESRRISYTWVGDEFLPNPTSAYEKLRLSLPDGDS